MARRQTIAEFDTTNTSAGTFSVPEGHNRWRVLVAHEGAPTAGDVQLFAAVPRERAPDQWLTVQLSSLPFNASGSVADGVMAPVTPARVQCAVSGWAGPAGARTTVIFESWSEA